MTTAAALDNGLSGEGGLNGMPNERWPPNGTVDIMDSASEYTDESGMLVLNNYHNIGRVRVPDILPFHRKRRVGHEGGIVDTRSALRLVGTFVSDWACY